MVKNSFHLFKLLKSKSRGVPKKALPVSVLLAATSLLFLSKVTTSNRFDFVEPETVGRFSGNASVTIWSPTVRCTGKFASAPASFAEPSFPSAVIRDAVIDHRYLSKEQFRTVHPNAPYLRIILYVSVHLSLSLTRRGAVAQMLVQGAPSPSLRAHVDYVVRVDPFLLLGPYKPGKKTKRGHQISEWQVAVSIIPTGDNSNLHQREFLRQIRTLSKESRGVLSLVLPLKRFDGVTERFSPSFDLGCATGWELSSSYPKIPLLNKEPVCHSGARKSKGAILFSGSALYGKKKVNPEYYSEVAHFAARALNGPLRFQNVAMSIVVNNSYSDRELACGSDRNCHAIMQEKNSQLLEDVRRVVEQVFEELRVERKLWSNLILLPFCRLGSDANGTEASDACRSSHRYGQYHATFFSYAMLSPFYKWAVSYDLDEFIANTPSSKGAKFVQQDASRTLDSVNRHSGYMFFSWLNFLVKDNSSIELTKHIMSGKRPELKGRGKECYAFTNDRTGKSAVRCDTGLGFTIHRPVIRKKNPNPTILDQIQGEHWSKSLRTWHPRFGSSRGKCHFAGIN